MIRSKTFRIVFILFCVLGVVAFCQDKQQVIEDKDQGLREEILAVYQSKGEQGLRDFFKKWGKEITGKFIVDFAQSGLKERKEEWLKACEIMAEERKDDKAVADVLYQMGEYFKLIYNYEKAFDYFEKALIIYVKIEDINGQLNVYWRKGIIYFYTGNNAMALEMYNKGNLLCEKSDDLRGRGNIYFLRGLIYSSSGETEKCQEMYDKALDFYLKIGDDEGQGTIYLGKGTALLQVGKNSEAIELYDRALVFYKKIKNSLGQGNIYLKKGEIYLRIGENLKALEMFDKALLFFQKEKEMKGQGNVYLNKGIIFSNQGDNSRALEMFDMAFIFFETASDPHGQGNTCFMKGTIYRLIGENYKAIEIYDKAMSFFEKAANFYGKGNVYWSKGEIYFKCGDNFKAIEMYDKALGVFEKIGDPIGKGNVYWSKGEIYLKCGDNFRAIEMYDKALIFFEKVGDPHGQGNVYEGKGDIFFRIGDDSKAIKMYDKAMVFYEESGDLRGKGIVYQHKGEVYFYSQKYSKALEMCQKALQLFETTEGLLGQGNVYNFKGNIYFRTNDNSKALEMQDKALPIFKKVGDSLGEGNVYWRKGEIFFKECDYSKAIGFYDKALMIFRGIGDIESEAFLLHEKAKVFVKQNKRNEALSFFEKAVINHEKVRLQTAFSDIQRTFMGMVYDQYEETVLFMLENKFYEKGFNYAESMKARVFLDQMSEGLSGLEKGLKADLKEEKDLLVGKLSALSRQLQETPGNEEKKLLELKEEYRKVESEFDDLLIKIRLENPLYASVNYPQPISVQDLQKDILKEGETILSYFTSQDESYAFVISKNNFHVEPLKIKENELNGRIKYYLREIKENDLNDMNKYGSLLYEKLFKPLEKYLEKTGDIIIIPAGQLETIPFESFIIDNKKTGPVYLLEKYRLKYVQNATLLSILRKNYNGDSTAKGFIGFGDPVYDYENFQQGKPEQGDIFSREGTRKDAKEKRLSSVPSVSSVAIEDEIKEIHRDRFARAGGIMDRLPESGPEVQSIAQLFEKESLATKVYLREQAAEENARAANMKDFAYIHFSCHGLLNDDFQCLVLSQLPGSKEDGYFTLNEIMNCDYNAKLIVLSACQTGSGKMARGEGITGLTRAFMYAGSPAVVASLWDVDDAATKELMVKFYSNMLEKNLDKVEALRQAKLELLKNEKYSSPLSWSAFVMYGE